MDQQFYLVDKAILVIYFFSVILFGMYFRKKSSTTDGFMIASARLPGWAVGLSMLGTFVESVEIDGLDADTYTVGVNPLDFPVSSANLQTGRTIETDFEPLLGGAVVVGAGQSVPYGTLAVDADVEISLGRSSNALPLVARIGVTTNHTLSGSGLLVGSTLTCSDPTITVGNVTWFGTLVSFQLTTPGGALPGHADLTATTVGGDVSILVSAVEFTPIDPVVTATTPGSGTIDGGEAVTLTGTGFRAGARVIIGANIYRDGAVGGCVVVNSTTITFTTRATDMGATDVVVMDPTGVEGRDVGGFTFVPIPSTLATSTGSRWPESWNSPANAPMSVRTSGRKVARTLSLMPSRA